MVKNVLIDPGMFHITDPDEIEKSCDFFQKVIWLCDSKVIKVCIYQGLIERIANRQIRPFPVNINDISDSKLKQKLLILNNSFIQTVTSNFLAIDVDDCMGEQEFETSREDLKEDGDYYELFCMMLRPCYADKENIGEKVLTDEHSGHLRCGAAVRIACKCQEKSFDKTYFWVKPSDLEDARENAYFSLKKLIENAEISFVEEPEFVRGDHHNTIQNGKLERFSDLSYKNKRVLLLLRSFGLYKIIFQDFKEDSSQLVGTIRVKGVRKGKDSEIVSGWIYCQTGLRHFVDMYFPVGAGYSLSTYMENDFSYDRLEKLKTRLAL